jgi:CBS domain-containing protein
MRGLAKVLAVLAAMAGVMVAAPIAQAAFPGENGKIAFESGRGTGTIWSMNPDGSSPSQISLSGERQGNPTWSPDGTKLAANSSTSNCNGYIDIVTINADGTGEVVLACSGENLYPSWSPDGKRIAYSFCSTSSEPQCQIRTRNADLSPGPSCIPNLCNYGTASGRSSWSPDGLKFAFCCVSVINVDGTNLVGHFSRNRDDPDWSPDGTKIAFTSYRDGNDEIYVMNADGSGQTRLTNNTTEDKYPAWSPDGTKIVFTSARDEPDFPGCLYTPAVCNYEIYVMNADGSGQTNLTNNPAYDSSPDWQPINYGYARPKSATRTELRFVPAHKACASPNASHGAPLALPSCSLPEPASDYLTVGTADSNGKATNFQGSGVIRTICNPPAPNPVPPCSAAGDQGDAQFSVSFTDIREKTTLLDYTGELQAKVTLRITDRYNGLCDGCPQPGTVTDVPFSFPVPCSTTPDTTIGASCAVTTTANTVPPRHGQGVQALELAVGQASDLRRRTRRRCGDCRQHSLRGAGAFRPLNPSSCDSVRLADLSVGLLDDCRGLTGWIGSANSRRKTRERLPMTIADVMTRDLPMVGPQDNLRKAAREMKEAGVKALPVREGDRLVGIITDWDVTRAVAEDNDPAEQLLSQCMTTDLVSVSPETSFMDATEEMADHRIHHLLVCEEGKFCGMVHLDVEWSELGGLETPIATFAAAI